MHFFEFEVLLLGIQVLGPRGQLRGIFGGVYRAHRVYGVYRVYRYPVFLRIDRGVHGVLFLLKRTPRERRRERKREIERERKGKEG